MNNIKNRRGIASCWVFALVFGLSTSVYAQQSYSPYATQNYPSTVYWGDTHLHTNLSMDAYGSGTRLTSEDAYRLARGDTVTARNGMKVRLQRPLNFLVIADHGESMGALLALATQDSALLNTESGKKWYEKVRSIALGSSPDAIARAIANNFYLEFKKADVGGKPFLQSVWNRVIDNAERNNLPNKFTAFIGFEWTSALFSPAYSGIHRVVIFKDGAEKANQVIPFTSNDSDRPEDLWTYLATYQNKTGGEILAIPHNSNLSKGRMFMLKDSTGKPLNRAYAETRARWEPLVEVTQIKGDSETHPILSPTDEFADYETWNSVAGSANEGAKTEGWEKRKELEYARSALKLGLDQQAKLGVNPFKFGLIGSTDSHTSLTTADENNFWGKWPLSEPSAERMMTTESFNWQMNAAGYAAVWATENTREALFAAMKRKEVYASTGPRMSVRFFGGWDYQSDDAFKPDLSRIGYEKGVPMGGDLSHAPKGKSPKFLIRAVKDPDGANLDRVQVIKGWHDKNGELHEKIYNVALSDGRKENKNGKASPVGSTVDVKDASYANSIGDPELAVVWQDPDFDKNELAFYYVRVLEIPTPRWTAFDAKYFGLKDIPEEIPMVTQERAYTSPIWYSPGR